MMKHIVIDDDLAIVEVVNPSLLIQNGEPIKIHLKGFTALELAKIIETITEYGGVTTENSKDAIVLSNAAWRSSRKTGMFRIDWLHDSIKRNKVLDLQRYQLRGVIAQTKIKEENFTLKEEDIKSEPDVKAFEHNYAEPNFNEVPSSAIKGQLEGPITIISSSDEEEMDSGIFTPDLESCISSFSTKIPLDSLIVDSFSLVSDEGNIVPKISDGEILQKPENSSISGTPQPSESTVTDIDSVTQRNTMFQCSTTRISSDSVNADFDTRHSDGESMEVKKSGRETIKKLDDSTTSETSDFSGRTNDSIKSSPLSRLSASSASHELSRNDSIEIITGNSDIIELDTFQCEEDMTQENQNDRGNMKKPNNSTTNAIPNHSGRSDSVIHSSASSTSSTVSDSSSEESSFSLASSSSETESSEDEDVDGLKKQKEKRKSSEAFRGSRKYNSYTKKEEKAMIDYLIDQKAIFRAGGVVIWQFMIDEGLLKTHKASSMRHHFETHLKHRVQDYTDDPEILKIFELREEAVETNRRLRKKRKMSKNISE